MKTQPAQVKLPTGGSSGGGGDDIGCANQPPRAAPALPGAALAAGWSTLAGCSVSGGSASSPGWEEGGEGSVGW